MADHAPDYQGFGDLTVPRRRASMPLIGEALAPWLAGAFVLAVMNLAMLASDDHLPVSEQTVVLLGLCASLAAAGMVAARSSRSLETSVREERARPAVEQLVDDGTELSTPAYVGGMVRWTRAMLDLVEHALDAAEPGSVTHDELTAAAEDTADLHELLQATQPDQLGINDTAMLHAVCTLWETGQPRIEQLAARLDASWHRRWRARVVADRRLRHGSVAPSRIALPYRT